MDEAWLHLADVEDIGSRRVVGFAWNSRPRKVLVWKTPAGALNQQLCLVRVGVATGAEGCTTRPMPTSLSITPIDYGAANHPERPRDVAP